MNTRRDLGGWLSGPPTDPEVVPGQAWGLPPHGPGSIAGYGRRFLGLLLDWAIASAMSAAFFHFESLATLFVFCAMIVVTQTLVGCSPGQRLVGIRLEPVTGTRPMVVRSSIRTLVMLTVVSGLIRSVDRQPLHDLAAGTAVVRL